MEFMTSEALNDLWEAEERARRHENEYWRLADELMDQGLVAIDDVAVIYGCHPATAQKRIKLWRDRVTGRAGKPVVDFLDP